MIQFKDVGHPRLSWWDSSVAWGGTLASATVSSTIKLSSSTCSHVPVDFPRSYRTRHQTSFIPKIPLTCWRIPCAIVWEYLLKTCCSGAGFAKSCSYWTSGKGTLSCRAAALWNNLRTNQIRPPPLRPCRMSHWCFRRSALEEWFLWSFWFESSPSSSSKKHQESSLSLKQQELVSSTDKRSENF